MDLPLGGEDMRFAAMSNFVVMFASFFIFSIALDRRRRSSLGGILRAEALCCASLAARPAASFLVAFFSRHTSG